MVGDATCGQFFVGWCKRGRDVIWKMVYFSYKNKIVGNRCGYELELGGGKKQRDFDVKCFT